MLTRAAPFDLFTDDDVLHGREVGRTVRGRVTARLEALPADTVLPLDFSRVRFLDFSCADELICKTVKRVAGGDLESRFVVLVGLSDTVHENVQAALELRQLVCVCDVDGSPELLGKVAPEVRETYALAVTLGRITARDVTEATRARITASSNRLTRLKEMGILALVANRAMEVGGRQNVFEPVR